MSFVNEKASFEKYGTRFQEDLVQIMLDDRAFCDQISEVLDANFLELKYLRLFVDKVFDYRKKYGTHPSRDTITTILRTEIEKIAENLFDKIRSRFDGVSIGDENAKATLDPEKARFFNFDFSVDDENYGNKTESAVASSLDRINVARLVAYIRARLEQIGSTFIFEPNDQITRNQFTNAVDGLMLDLVAKRGIYDYLIVCDLTNNTPARIDRNELYMDIAIEPVKAVEFIYIPVRLKNTGEIAAGQVATSAGV